MTDQIAKFVRCVYEPDDVVEIRALRKGEDGRTQTRKRWIRAKALAAATPELVALNQQGFNVYVGANPRTAEGLSGDDNVTTCRCLFADFDAMDEDAALERIAAASLPLPTLLIASGHGVHAYWRLTVPVDGATFRELQDRLASTIDSDRKVKNPERVMRLPGFDNVKAAPVPCRIIACDPDRRFDVADIVAKLKTIHAPIQSTSATEHRQTTRLEARGREALYMAKCPGVSEGERNDAAFRHAKTLVNDFEVDEAEAWPLLSDWNRANQPPLDEAELRQVFESAQRSPSAKTRGCKLDERRESCRCNMTKPTAPKAKTISRPSAKLEALLSATIEGRRTALEWRYPGLNRMTQALLPGCVTVICGPKGSTKTFFILENFTHWMLNDIRCAMLVLEEDVEHCLLRCLAQLSGAPDVTKTDWVEQNPAEARRIHAEHASEIDRLGAGMWDTPDDEMTLPEITKWIESRAIEGCRVIIVDPITAAKETDSPWKADKTFVNEVKRLARRHGVSVVMATHPIKGGTNTISMDSLSGSTAWVRFSHVIFWLEAHDPRDVVVMKPCGRAMVSSNRTLHILAARNAYGQGRKIAMNFYRRFNETIPPQLTFKCEGMVLRKNENTVEE